MRILLSSLLTATLASSSLPLTAQTPAAKPAERRNNNNASQAASDLRSYKDLTFPALNSIKVPQPVRFTMENGITVFLVEDHELPTVGLTALIRGGERNEPADKTGLAGMTGRVMRTGGSTTRPGEALDRELDRRGITVETGIGNENGFASVSCLKEDVNYALPILADLLQNPSFPQDKIELAKTASRDAIARRNEDPGDIASREFSRLIYGKTSPYARIEEYATLNSIQRQDLVAFHKQYFQPENMIVGVWGDFDAATMRARLESVLGGWKKGGQPKPEVPTVDPATTQRGGVYVVDKDDINQSTVYIGGLGGKRNDPDYIALNVMSYALGSGFGSRLMKVVRSEQGLAYSVGAGWGAQYDFPGLFRAAGGTKSENTGKMVNSIKAEIERIRQSEITDGELALAKDAILKGAAFDFDSTGKIVNRLMTYEFYGYPADYLQRFQEGVRKVTKADVLRVAQTHWKPENMLVLIVGNTKEFGQPVSALGTVTPLDVTIPSDTPAGGSAPATAQPSSPQAMERGKELLSKAQQAMGGAALTGMKNYSLKGTNIVKTPQGEATINGEIILTSSGKSITRMTTPIGEVTQGFNGTAVWLKTPQGMRDSNPAAVAEANASIARDTVMMLARLSSLSAQALGQQPFQGKPAEAVLITDPARKLEATLYLDPQSFLPVGKSYNGRVMGQPGQMEEAYSNYQEVAGMKLPMTTMLNRNGQPFAEQKVTKYEVNTNLPDSTFEKP